MDKQAWVEEKQGLEKFSFVVSEKQFEDRAKYYDKHGLPKGKSTGWTDLDNHWMLKENTFVVWLGHDNVGKSIFLWQLLVIANHLYGWRGIIYSAENKVFSLMRQMIQFKTGTKYETMTTIQKEGHRKWFYDNFTIINPELDYEFNCQEIVDNIKIIQQHDPHQIALIDPYNSLTLPEGVRDTHSYHYREATRLRKLTNIGISVWVTMHTYTEAQRRRHKDKDVIRGEPVAGYTAVPWKSDCEGGTKWSSRADDFVILHRYTNHNRLYKELHIHVGKVKETETGGKQTYAGDPVVLTYVPEKFTFVNDRGKNPLRDVPDFNRQTEIKLPYKDDEIDPDKPPF